MSKALIIPNADFSENKLTTVTFGTIPCTAISLSSNEETLTAIGGTVTLTATLTPANTTDTLSWESSDDSVVSVINGVLTALTVGEAVITATCGEQTATCSVSVNVIPDYVVDGAFNPYRTNNKTQCNINNMGTDNQEYKYGIIALDNSDVSARIVDCFNTSTGLFRLCPIPIVAGAKRIKIESSIMSGSTVLGFKTRALWFDSTKNSQTGNGAKCLGGLTSNSSWDQDSLSTTHIIDIPDDLTGLDSFAVGLIMSDWKMKYNTDYSANMAVTFLPAAST